MYIIFKYLVFSRSPFRLQDIYIYMYIDISNYIMYYILNIGKQEMEYVSIIISQLYLYSNFYVSFVINVYDMTSWYVST